MRIRSCFQLLIRIMLLMLKLLCFGECTGITYVDSTYIPVCHNKRIKRNKVFKGYAEVSKNKNQVELFL